MATDRAFQDLIGRVRIGDEDAAAELVRRYESSVRRVVRFRLKDDRLRSILDSMDICQSVLASFFVRAAAGEFDIDEPDQLLRLLSTMARNKLASQARKQRAQRRDPGRPAARQSVEQAGADDSSPSHHAAARELLREVQRRLSPEERELVELRKKGWDWAAIASQLGTSAVLLRKRFSRTLDRVTRELGLNEST